MHNHQIIKKIQQSNHLPEIPKSLGEILKMLLEPAEFNMDECIKKISQIPQLELTLRQILNNNSKLKREILSLKDAVLYLGAKNTKIITIAHLTRLLLPNKSGRARLFNNKIYWQHCIGTSIASWMIAAETGLCDKEKMFTYGLIHDVGVIVLDICLPEYLNKISQLQGKGVHQIAAEKVVLNGLTHTEIGMWVCKEWGLPAETIEIVGYHHSPFIKSKVSNEVKIMYLADSISTNYYEKLLGNDTTFIYSSKMKEMLNLPDGLLEEVSKKMPEEVEKVNGLIEFEL